MLFTELAFRGPHNVAIFTCHINVKSLNGYLYCESHLRVKD